MSIKAAIVAVGSEMLGPERLDTNSLRLTRVLERYGVSLVAKSVVGDDEVRMAEEFRRRLDDAELVLVTGGLGPTADDVTRPAAARALGRGVTIDEAIVEHIRRLFASFGRRMPEVNRRQAEVIDGAVVLENQQGSAPGQRIDVEAKCVFLFPGVPRELDFMISKHLEPWLRGRTGGADGVERWVVKVACLPESELEERIAPAYREFGREGISVLASPGEIKIYIEARGGEAERRSRLDAAQRVIVSLAGDTVFSVLEEDSLEAVVGRLLTEASKTLTTAESCTGGLIAERLTRVAGSSAFFLGGVVSYSNAIKTQLLGVSEEMLGAHGAVSEPVARAMAEGARVRYGSDYGISVTGIAGPGGGTEEKPVGTIHMALAGPGDGDVTHRRLQLPGDRDRVRQMTSQWALEMLRRDLLGRT